MTFRAQNQSWKFFCVTFVFCIDYKEKNGQFMPQELFPFVFFSPKSIKFELSAL